MALSKSKTRFFCQSCGYEYAKNDWRQESGRSKVSKPKTLNEIESSGEIRIATPDLELNRVLGGGIVPGSLVLIGGEPGIGKSTLMLQIGLALQKAKVLYVSGEESEQQIKMRSERISLKDKISLSN